MLAEDKKVTSEIEEKQNLHEDAGGMERVAEELSTVADQHRGLKTLVLLLGLVLLALFVFVVYAIANRAAESFLTLEEPAAELPIAAADAPPQMAALVAGDFAVSRPEGSTLVSVTGNARELIFHFRDAAGSDLVVLVDRTSGTQTPIRVP
jgi:hypothetical protein